MTDILVARAEFARAAGSREVFVADGQPDKPCLPSAEFAWNWPIACRGWLNFLGQLHAVWKLAAGQLRLFSSVSTDDPRTGQKHQADEARDASKNPA